MNQGVCVVKTFYISSVLSKFAGQTISCNILQYALSKIQFFKYLQYFRIFYNISAITRTPPVTPWLITTPLQHVIYKCVKIMCNICLNLHIVIRQGHATTDQLKQRNDLCIIAFSMSVMTLLILRTFDMLCVETIHERRNSMHSDWKTPHVFKLFC